MTDSSPRRLPPFDPDAFGGPATPPSVETTLTERGKRYGEFTGHAAITQELKHAMRRNPRWPALHPDQAEALEMIAHKIGRILNGDPNYHDSWHDIAGYATLVADRLAKNDVSVAE